MLGGIICTPFWSWEEEEELVDPLLMLDGQDFFAPENESDGFQYVLGVTAMKFEKKFPELVTPDKVAWCQNDCLQRVD